MKSRGLWWSGTVLLLVVGAGVFWQLFARIFVHWDSAVFGDDGDGFFNLWVMMHNINPLREFSLASIFKGGTFYPSELSLLKSDTLFFPSEIYRLSRAWFDHPWGAYSMTVMTLSLMGFLAYIFFFRTVLQPMARNSRPAEIWFWSVAGALVTWFSAARLHYYHHFQNLSSFWLVLMVAFLIRFALHPSHRNGIAAALCFVLLNYSSQYFAILAACLILTYLVFFLASRGIGPSLTILREKGWSGFACGLLAMPIILSYALLVDIHVAFEGMWPVRVHASDFFTPLPYTPARDWLVSRGVELKVYNHENLGWYGTCLFLILVTGVTAWVLRRRDIPGALRRNSRSWIFVVTLALLAFPPGVGDAAVGLRLIILATASVFVVLMAGQFAGDKPGRVVPLLLLLFAVVAYGFAAGPSRHYGSLEENVSLWGIFNAVVPGLRRMRALGRMAPMGQIFLCGLSLVLILRIIRFRAVIKTAVVVLLLGSLYEQNYEPWITYPSDEVMFASADESLYFDDIDQPVLVLPSVPFQKNTAMMLYFLNFPGVHMINGYSGSSSPEFMRIMHLESSGAPTGEVLQAAAGFGARHLLLVKERLSPEKIAEIRRMFPGPEFENGRFLAFSLDRLHTVGRPELKPRG